MTEGEAKDVILKHCLSQAGKSFDANQLRDQAFENVEVELSQIEIMIRRISECYPDSVAWTHEYEGGFIIASNDQTEYFLNKTGGFTERERKLAAEQDKKSGREQLEIELAKSNLRANKLNEEVAERNRKAQRFNRVFLIINALFAITNIVIAIVQWLSSVQPE